MYNNRFCRKIRNNPKKTQKFTTFFRIKISPIQLRQLHLFFHSLSSKSANESQTSDYTLYIFFIKNKGLITNKYVIVISSGSEMCYYYIFGE